MTQDYGYNISKSHQLTDGKLNKKMSYHELDNTSEFNIQDEDVFKSICSGNLRKKLAESNTFKSNSIDVHITGPFFNKRTGKKHWVIVYGDSGKSYLLKPRFIGKYLSCLLLDWKKVKKTNVNIDHVSTMRLVFGSMNLALRANRSVAILPTVANKVHPSNECHLYILVITKTGRDWWNQLGSFSCQ
jgi:hypothetical protein